MKIAILADSHDHMDHLRQALTRINGMDVDCLLACGDLSAPFMYNQLVTEFTKPIHAIFGNNDAASIKLAEIMRNNPHLTHHDQYANITLDGKRIGMTHYPFYADKMAKSGDFDLVCFGHDHTQRFDEYGHCIAVNPGALIGEGQDTGFAVYDTATHTVELYQL